MGLSKPLGVRRGEKLSQAASLDALAHMSAMTACRAG
jgi:hypothetical protein